MNSSVCFHSGNFISTIRRFHRYWVVKSAFLVYSCILATVGPLRSGIKAFLRVSCRLLVLSLLAWRKIKSVRKTSRLSFRNSFFLCDTREQYSCYFTATIGHVFIDCIRNIYWSEQKVNNATGETWAYVRRLLRRTN